MNRQDYQEWLTHPVTKALHQYYHNFRQAIIQGRSLAFENGIITGEREQAELMAQINLIKDMIELEFDDIEAFNVGDEGDDSSNDV